MDFDQLKFAPILKKAFDSTTQAIPLNFGFGKVSDPRKKLAEKKELEKSEITDEEARQIGLISIGGEVGEIMATDEEVVEIVEKQLELVETEKLDFFEEKSKRNIAPKIADKISGKYFDLNNPWESEKQVLESDNIHNSVLTTTSIQPLPSHKAPKIEWHSELSKLAMSYARSCQSPTHQLISKLPQELIHVTYRFDPESAAESRFVGCASSAYSMSTDLLNLAEVKGCEGYDEGVEVCVYVNGQELNAEHVVLALLDHFRTARNLTHGFEWTDVQTG